MTMIDWLAFCSNYYHNGWIPIVINQHHLKNILHSAMRQLSSAPISLFSESTPLYCTILKIFIRSHIGITKMHLVCFNGKLYVLWSRSFTKIDVYCLQPNTGLKLPLPTSKHMGWLRLKHNSLFSGWVQT